MAVTLSPKPSDGPLNGKAPNATICIVTTAGGSVGGAFKIPGNRPIEKATMQIVRFFGLIPAAGRSRRMGQHKLMLPWHDARIIDRVLQAWTSSRVSTQQVEPEKIALKIRGLSCFLPETQTFSRSAIE